MAVIAVINRKGGSGKSTLAAHIAAWCARRGEAVMLGDVDRQQSSRTWLRRRPGSLPPISPWAIGDMGVARLPSGIRHAVLDTPGGLHGFELARVVMIADAILMPVGHSGFDRDSAASSHAELMTLPRVAGNRCRIAAVGMRIDRRTRGEDILRDWARDRGLEFLGALREAQCYVRNLDEGRTLFDLTEGEASAIDLAQWESIIRWLSPLFAEPVPAVEAPRAVAGPAPGHPGTPRIPQLMPAQESLACGARLSSFAGASRAPRPVVASAPRLLPAVAAGLTREQIPPILRRSA